MAAKQKSLNDIHDFNHTSFLHALSRAEELSKTTPPKPHTSRSRPLNPYLDTWRELTQPGTYDIQLNHASDLYAEHYTRMASFAALIATTKPGHAIRICCVVQEDAYVGITFLLCRGRSLQQPECEDFCQYMETMLKFA